MIQSGCFITATHQRTIQKAYLRTVLAFAHLNNYVDLISYKFYISLIRLFHLNSQLFAQKNYSCFTLFLLPWAAYL